MLQKLRIRNLAVIQDLEVDFQPGLNVLTGETGAGKSILMDSLRFLGGERFDKTLIRTGENRVTIEGHFRFDRPLPPLMEFFEDEEDRREIILRRELYEDERQRVFINNEPFKLPFLRQLAPYLYSLYGQHDQRNLASGISQRELLDLPQEHLSLLADLDGASRSVWEAEEALKRVEEREKERGRREEYLRYVIAEFEGLDFREENYRVLQEKKKVFQNSETIVRNLQESLNLIQEGEPSLLELLGPVEKNLAHLAPFKKEWEELGEELATFRHQLEDAASRLSLSLGEIDYTPEELEETEESLARLEKLYRKYGGEAEMGKRLGEAVEEMKSLESLEFDREESLQRRREGERRWTELAARLTSLRLKRASYLEKHIVGELQELGMKSPLFKVQMTAVEPFSPTGAEEAEFLFSSNAGETPRPLSKVASGGELSRIMLALKLLSQEEASRTFIFDEIDSGVGGGTAERVGEKLLRLAKDHQILCITHFPQVAAFGDHHFRVEKEERGGRTFSTVRSLAEDERVAEIARLMAGTAVSESLSQGARELIERARNRL